MIRRVLFGACAAAGLALPAAGQGTVFFLNPVFQLPAPGSFEVVDRLGTDTARIWCDAGRAARNFGARGNQRIYVTRAYGPSRSQPSIDGVSFSFAPEPDVLAAADRLGSVRSLTLKKVGNNMSIGQANGYCVFEIDG